MRKYIPITKNRRARHDFDIEDNLLAGVVLVGAELKSIRQGKADLKGSFATMRENEVWLHNVSVPPYQAGKDLKNYDPTRARKLLLHKRQIRKLAAARQNGLHLVPVSIGKQGRFIKVEIGIGKSKKKRDKREAIKKRAAKREADKHIKRKR